MHRSLDAYFLGTIYMTKQRLCDSELSGQAGALAIEITPKMIEAGRDIVYSHFGDIGVSTSVLDEALTKIYRLCTFPQRS